MVAIQEINAKASVQQLSYMRIKELTNNERRKVFIEKSNALKLEGLTFKQISGLTGMNYKRMKNIRSEKPPHVYPSILEMDAIIELHERRFPAIEEPEGETPKNFNQIREKLNELEIRIAQQESFNDSQRLSLIERLTELGSENASLQQEIEGLKKQLKK